MWTMHFLCLIFNKNHTYTILNKTLKGLMPDPPDKISAPVQVKLLKDRKHVHLTMKTFKCYVCHMLHKNTQVIITTMHVSS